MTGFKQVFVVLFSVFMLMAAGGAASQQVSSVVSKGYEGMGILDHIDFAARQVIISGKSYNFADGMAWYGLEPGSGPSDQLHRFYKKRVGYKRTWVSGVPKVSAIWIPSQSSQ